MADKDEKTQKTETEVSTSGKRREKPVNEPENVDIPTEMPELEEAQEKGYFGVTPDPTPNYNYTVAGVLEGAPTPETDMELAREVHAELRDPYREFIDVDETKDEKKK
jgi:hypothetical protein